MRKCEEKRDGKGRREERRWMNDSTGGLSRLFRGILRNQATLKHFCEFVPPSEE